MIANLRMIAEMVSGLQDEGTGMFHMKFNNTKNTRFLVKIQTLELDTEIGVIMFHFVSFLS